MATMTIDDEIAEVGGQLAAFQAELDGRRDAAAAARAELDQLAASEPESNRGDRGVAWIRQREAAARRHSQATSGLQELERRIDEQTRWLAQLELRRVPKFDAAIGEARARLAEIPTELEAQIAAAKTLEARIRGYDVAEAVGDPMPAGEPAASTANLEAVRSAIATLEAERTRLDLRVATLLERRQADVVELVAHERGQVLERWAVLADEALTAGVRLHAISVELEALEQDHRAIGGRHGLRGDRVPTVDDQRWEPEHLERGIVNVARGLALRNG